jgi:ArsR family transcriptional regulator, arsenate/arsenite/antimonite-responsive transcriptional repressor
LAEKKTDEFTQDEIFLADLAKALSHPARIKILKILYSSNTCMCGDIVDRLPLSQSTVSQHLKELKRVGLIQGEIEGPKTCYCLNGSMLKEAWSHFEKLFTKLKSCC